MTTLKCSGCSAWGTPGQACGVFYMICDCGTITTVRDYSDVWRAQRLIWKKRRY